MSLGDDIVILETTSTEVKNRILKSHELLRAIDTGELYIGGKDGKPQALIASSTTSDGVIGIQLPGKPLTPMAAAIWSAYGGGRQRLLVFGCSIAQQIGRAHV